MILHQIGIHENIFISILKLKSSALPPPKKKNLKNYLRQDHTSSYIRRGSFIFLFINILISLIFAES